MTTAYVALGANLGEAPATLRAALADINAVPGLRVVKGRGLYHADTGHGIDVRKRRPPCPGGQHHIR